MRVTLNQNFTFNNHKSAAKNSAPSFKSHELEELMTTKTRIPSSTEASENQKSENFSKVKPLKEPTTPLQTLKAIAERHGNKEEVTAIILSHLTRKK